MDQRAEIITLAEVYAAHASITHWSVSMRIFGKGDFFHKLINKGWDCRTRTAVRAKNWFSENWPDDLEWPEDVIRPDVKGKGEAA